LTRAYPHCRYSTMVVKIQRWGNSLALRLPKAVVMDAGVDEGSTVDVVATQGKIVVRARRRYALADLLAQISAKNLHAEVSTGRPRGRESW